MPLVQWLFSYLELKMFSLCAPYDNK